MKYLLIVTLLMPTPKPLVIGEYDNKELCELEIPRAQATWFKLKLTDKVIFSCEPLE